MANTAGTPTGLLLLTSTNVRLYRASRSTGWADLGATKSTQTFLYKVFQKPFGSWTSAPKIVDVRTKKCVFCGPGDGEKLFDPGSSKRKGQECPREIRTKKFMFMLFFLKTCRSITGSATVPSKIADPPGFPLVNRHNLVASTGRMSIKSLKPTVVALARPPSLF